LVHVEERGDASALHQPNFEGHGGTNGNPKYTFLS